MSLTKELINQETLMAQGGERGVIHLHHEGSFYRAYEWSAYLSCRYLHEFKVNGIKRDRFLIPRVIISSYPVLV